MSDRIRVLIAVPTDDALPLDVQGVGLRRRAIDLMKELGTVNESSVRYRGTSDTAYLDLGGEVGLISLWQHNLIAVQFIADGDADKEIVGPVVHYERDIRFYSHAAVVRNEFD